MDEACEYFGGLLHRRVEALDREKFHLSVATAMMRVMAITAVESTGGMQTRAQGDEKLYTLIRLESGAWERNENGEQILITPGQGLLIPPNRGSISTLHGKFS